MSLLDEIKQEGDKGPKCTLFALWAKLNPEETKDLAEALADLGISGVAIARALQKRGHKISGDTIQRHRRKVCNCEPR